MDYASPAGRRPGAFSPMPSSTTQGPHLQARGIHRRSHSSGSDSSSSSHITAMSGGGGGGGGGGGTGGGGKRIVYNGQQRPPMFSTTSSNSSSSSLQGTAQHPSITHVIGDAPMSRKNSPLNPGSERTHKRNNSQGFFEPSLPSASLLDQGNTLTASQIAAQAAMQHQNSHTRKRSQTVPSPLSPPETGKQKPPPLPIPQPASARKAGFPGQSGSPAAASAANAAHQRQLSPGMTSFADLPVEKEKEKSKNKMKLFSKPKHIGIPGMKDDKGKTLPSPGRASPGPGLFYKNFNASSTSLIDSVPQSAASIYSMSNASNSTLMPKAEEKSHRNFLSRQKHKLKDKMDDHSLTLSSAASNSKPVNPDAPGSIYSFAPSSPGLNQGGFSKSVSGLDLRHGGRALREKREKESDWLGASGLAISTPAALNMDFNYGNLQGFGLSNMTADEAWDFLKAKILIIFEGEELKMTVEDLNKLVSVHIQRSVQRKTPSLIIEDLEDLLRIGFLSLDQTLRGVPEDKLIPVLVEMWLFVFGYMLPYIQAVFLPLDLEFRGTGTMSARDAAEFWGGDLDVRRMVLLSYRDNIILPKHDILQAIFSRLSLESINVDVDSPALPSSPRPGSSGPVSSSYNSQGSLLTDGSRSRATSNTSTSELFSPAPPRANNAQRQDQGVEVTEMVGRVLQCMSVLASLRSDDDAQIKIEEITKALKLNWLGRGRTGRNRKGFVGARMPRVVRV